MSDKIKFAMYIALLIAIVLLIVAGPLLIVKLVAPQAVPWDIVQWNKGNFNLWTILDASKYWIIVYFLVNASILFLKREDPTANNFHKSSLKSVLGRSLLAGIWEELFFRWIAFLSAIVWLQILNWVLGGFLGWRGLIDFLDRSIFIPVADAFTRGMLHEYLYYIPPTLSWVAVGSAILLTSNNFRDGHKYLGCLGWVLAWFMGMFFFYMTFTYGLLAAIVSHTIVDVVAFGVGYIDSLIWPRLYPDLANDKRTQLARLFMLFK